MLLGHIGIMASSNSDSDAEETDFMDCQPGKPKGDEGSLSYNEP